MIKSINFDEHEIINDILLLHVKRKTFEVDPTYGRGKFYNGLIDRPYFVSDLNPRFDYVKKCCATDLPLASGSVSSLIFDPPFVAGHTKKPTGIIGEKYFGFPYMRDVWNFYSLAINEHHRVLKDGAIYVFKCQDSCSSDKNWISHVRVIALAERLGFYVKDIFILLSKNRLIGHNHKHTQKHARKFHSYFIVFEKTSKFNKQSCSIIK